MDGKIQPVISYIWCMDKGEDKDKPKKKYEPKLKVNATLDELSKVLIRAKPKPEDGKGKK